MKKLLIIGIGILLLSTNPTVKAQSYDGLDLIYNKQHTVNKKPIPYQTVREADLFWSKVIWRIVDLREKINHPLYFPTQPIGSRRSMIDVILEAVDSLGLQAYSPRDDNNEFKVPITFEDIKEEFDATEKIQEVIQDNITEETTMDTIVGQIHSEEVMQILVKELWFFDKQRSVMDVRVIGFCPIRLYYQDQAIDDANLNLEPTKKKLFWVKYTEARPFLANSEVFNPGNDAARLSFDDIFYKRKFNGYIVKESNVWDNRNINSYLSGMEIMMETNRIEEFIFNFGHDLWEY
ncbi:gliding motility protein GldN [Bacteroidota bacterium]